MEFQEIYCHNCHKTLGKYNVKFYSETQIAEIIQTIHADHIKIGHHVEIRRKKSK
ncbi:MAG: hypothetical protein VB736_00350 [Candidatus Nitrosopelagicus sp.]|jgi:hypothetical protein|uniref:Uncharacterized protein n=1 Tax=uncultured marine thaumarchaeote SAT1000_06_A02 TaxID=1456359 RepID=A0A075I192_9ARCH|nr:hypothetical protein [uncultured marine thaumarchaeote SAT1000_06_A02]